MYLFFFFFLVICRCCCVQIRCSVFTTFSFELHACIRSTNVNALLYKQLSLPADRPKEKNTNILWTQLRECEAGKKCSKANTKWNSTSKLRAIAASFRCFILIAIRSAPIRINITANCNPGFRLRLKSHWHHFFRLFESGGSHLSWNDSEISRNRILGRSKLIL